MHHSSQCREARFVSSIRLEQLPTNSLVTTGTLHSLIPILLWLTLTIGALSHAGSVHPLVNGSFEQGLTGWHANTIAGTSSAGILAGSYPNKSVEFNSKWYAYVGDRTSDLNNSIGSVFQVFDVPANATTATLSFWLNVTTYEDVPLAYDLLDVTLRSYPADALLSTLNTYDNSDSITTDNEDGRYTLKTLPIDLTTLRGQTILLQFYADTDNTGSTIFRIDDVDLAVTTVDVAPNLVPYTPPGWEQSLIITKTAGSRTEPDVLFSSDHLYLTWAIQNTGTAPTTLPFSTEVTIDQFWWRVSWPSPGNLGVGDTETLSDYYIGQLPVGTHNVILICDSTDTIPTEHDGTYAKDIIVYPTPPSDFQCLLNGTTIHLTWKNNATDATGSRITRTRGDNGERTLIDVDRWTTAYDDNNVLRSVQYCYTVAATAAGYASPESTACCAQVGRGDPPEAAIASPNIASPGALVHFVNNGSRGDGYRYFWTTDDGQSTSSLDADFRLYALGQHRVELRVSAPGSGFADATATTYIDIQPQIVGNGNGGSTGNTRVTSGADPVNLASGNYIYSHSDLTLPGIGMPFEFTRYYNSRAVDQTPGSFGYGWTFTPSISVFEFGTNAVVSYGDGHSETHSFTDSGYVGSAGVFDRLVKQDDTTWLIITKSQTTNVVDSVGRLLRIVDKNGNAIQLTYDPGNGRLATVVDTAGRTTTFQPHDKYPSLVGAIEDVLGRRVVFDYDERTNLIAVTNPHQNTTRFAYDLGHQMTDAWDNRRNLIVHNDYDQNLRVVFHQYDAYTNHTYFSFDFTNRVTMQTNSMGGVSTYTFNSNLLLTNVTDEAKNEQTFGYDDHRNRVYFRDRNGHETLYIYDDRGNVTKKIDALGNPTTIEYDSRNNPIHRTDALGNTTTFIYDERGNMVGTTNALGLSTSIQYDAHGLPLVVTDARGISTTNEFDTQGNLIAVINTRGNANRFAYDMIGRKILQVDALGRTNTFTYDANNNLLLSVNALGFTNAFAYDANNNRVLVQDPRGATTLTTFDLKDRLVSITEATNHVVSNTYDALDRKVLVVDARSNATGYAYDPTGNLLAVTNALLDVTQFTYDKNQNQISITDSAGNTTAKAYDALNRLILTVDPLAHTNATAYDALGRLVCTTNANGQLTTFKFDAIGRLTNVIDAAQQAVYFDYDANGNRIRTTDPNGHTPTNVFDNLNRLVEQWDPLGHKTAFFYDVAGNLTNKITPNGDSIVYAYDALNRLTNVAYPDHSTVTFAYDTVGNRTNMVDWSGQTIWQYDLLNRVVSVTDSFGRTVAYQYDENGNRTALVYPGGNTVTYGYDPLNRMAGFTNWLGGVTTYRYDNRGNVISTTNANQTTVAYVYDLVGRLIGLTNTLPDGTVLASYNLDLDPIGNHRQLTFNQPLLPILQAHTNLYTYDTDNRLLSVDSQHITHDANGNLTSWGADTFTYDYENRLIAHTLSNSVSYVYDGLGNRLTFFGATGQSARVTRDYVLDRVGPLTRVLVEVDDGVPSTYYVSGLGLAQRITPDESVSTYHFDTQGSTIALSNSRGTPFAYKAYDSFGVLVSSDGVTREPFCFLGQHGIIDDGVGLYYARARYFSPHLSRFITKDPLAFDTGNDQRLNQYSYALNNPLLFGDPSGLTPQELQPTTFGGMCSDESHSVLLSNQEGQPSFLVSLIPIYGSARLAVYDFRNKHYWWAAFNTAMAISDVLLVKSAATAIAKVGAKAFVEETAERGFRSFAEFKQEVGPARPGFEWHHIVEQHSQNVSVFGAEAVHNTGNLIEAPYDAHRALSGFYSSKQEFTNGQTVREWLKPQSFEAQFEFGLQALKAFGIIK